MRVIIKKVLKRKMSSGALMLAILVIGYFGYTKFFTTAGAVRYVTAEVRKGTIVVSISGNGQVSASNQVDIKPKVSGDTVYIGVINGQAVRAGALIVQLDAREAEKAVRDAQANLESSKIALEKLKKPADVLSILQAEHALAQSKESKQTAEDDLTKAYENGFNTVATAFLDLSSAMTGLRDILFGTNFSSSQPNLNYYSDAVATYDQKVTLYRDDAARTYQASRDAYEKNFTDYKSASRFADTATIEKLIRETYETNKSAAEAIKSANNLIQFYQDKLTERGFKPSPLSDTHLAGLNSYTGKINTHLINLLTITRAIQDSKQALVNADRSIAEKTESLAKLKTGADALDIQSSELSVTQKENALTDAKEKRADYFIRAPFDGVIAKLNVKKGDAVSPAAAIATLITAQKIAEISLNEIDVAKIKIGQKATLTFDAIPDLTITGQVAEVDAVGTVSQGVVTYTVKIGFDAQDDRVKTAMSVSAAIITEAKPDALLVANSAIKQEGGTHYVEVPDAADKNAAADGKAGSVPLTRSPRHKTITIGLSNDTVTEIVSGLLEGTRVITRTIQPSATTQTQIQTGSQSSGGLRIPGITGGGFRGGGGGR
ncbi:MAG: Uncharacterized protein G01um101433_27 [Parcubacteria group bacterium Gr01-1014_33]|nr:MAG: Uncharacterized protein G01um101433_27 [Parcubacteria group bacterium Gr01-1014_33]